MIPTKIQMKKQKEREPRNISRAIESASRESENAFTFGYTRDEQALAHILPGRKREGRRLRKSDETSVYSE